MADLMAVLMVASTVDCLVVPSALHLAELMADSKVVLTADHSVDPKAETMADQKVASMVDSKVVPMVVLSVLR